VKESIHRIERALVNSGFVLPVNRVVINLAPAELPKQAVVVRPARRSRPARRERADRLRTPRPYAIVGELALDGAMRPVKGALSMAMAAAANRASRPDRPQRQRRRGCGRRRDRGHPRRQRHPGRRVPHRATPHRADAVARRRAVRRTRLLRRRLCRRARPRDGQARRHDRGSRPA
jgi:hypothetical protein